MNRALSLQNLLDTNIPIFDFDGEWREVFGTPQRTGIWFIYGASGHGKTSFVMQLIKKLAEYDKVLYESYEEGVSENLKKNIKRFGMLQFNKRVIVAIDTMIELKERLAVRKSPKIVIIDSLDISEFTTMKQINDLAKKYPQKLFIFTGWANGRMPAKKLSNSVLFIANQKIFIEGFRAFSRGRSYGEKDYYTIWSEGASKTN
jgi:pantothenate kinase-related protein Tda10